MKPGVLVALRARVGAWHALRTALLLLGASAAWAAGAGENDPAARFRGPPVYDFGVTERQQAYLIMELLRGRSLRHELRQKGRLPPERSAHILRGVCSAVDEAHQHGLLHRDLKPDNIFLVQAERQDIAKVLDFGLARPIRWR